MIDLLARRLHRGAVIIVRLGQFGAVVQWGGGAGAATLAVMPALPRVFIGYFGKPVQR